MQRPQLLYYAQRCLKCGECQRVCPNGCHEIKEREHLIHRDQCVTCGKCVEACPCSALEITTHEISTEQLMEILIKDRPFFGSNGGITFSGGEPLLQPGFVLDVFKNCKKEGIGTALETALNVDPTVVDAVSPYTDHFFIDLKHIREEEHKKGTGVSLRPILENIKRLDSYRSIVLRTPVIPGFNEEYLGEMAEFIGTLHNVSYVQLMPFHVYGVSKYRALGIPYAAEDLKEPDKKTLIEKYASLYPVKVII